MRHTAAFGLVLTSLIGVAFFVIDARATTAHTASAPIIALATSTRAATPDMPAPAPAYAPQIVHTAAVASVREIQTEATLTTTATTSLSMRPTKAIAHLTITASTTRSYELPITDGESLADAMTDLVARSDFTFRSHESSGMGIFIDSIEGLANDGGYYWILWINGAKAGVGASSLVLHPSDDVGWRYEKGY